MKLIGSLSSPFVRKVRIVMAEKKIEYQLEIEEVWSEHTRISEINPLGQVPCLLIEETVPIYDSRVICEYLDTLTPVGKLLPPSGRERANVHSWEALGDGVMDAVVLIRAESTQRDPSQRSEKWLTRQQRKVELGVAAMSKGLGSNAWCSANHFNLADIAVGCALGYLDLRAPDFDWRDAYPNLKLHFEKLSSRQSFIDTAAPV
ncbi:MAG: glutathione S-transferase N-terminal domain-containing protein [Janthinobacterium lividum]